MKLPTGVIVVGSLKEFCRATHNIGIFGIVFGDIHLGAPHNESKRLLSLCKQLEKRSPDYRLIVQGDTFDSADLRKLTREDYNFMVYLIRRVRKDRGTIVAGNHDRELFNILEALGVQFEVREECILEVASSRILITHGDKFDDITSTMPHTTSFGDVLYRLTRLLDGKKKRASKKAKNLVKLWLQVIEHVRIGACARARELGCTHVMCGHVHQVEQGVDTSATPPILYTNVGHALDEIGVSVISTDGTVHTYLIEP